MRRICQYALCCALGAGGVSAAAATEFTLWGYADALSARPGEVLRFMVSSESPEYEAQLVRLIHGDTNPLGPGFKEEEIAAPFNGTRPGRYQPLRAGSHIVIPDHEALVLQQSFTLQAW
ncbi:MAG: hypothetical protein QGH25_19720, partial [Candidatus Latescibacteria bacterium]|nr:hypothetical protein [Candidatus Latescibacterota bacterium]